MSSTENTPSTGFKPKKSVALSGVVAGNTALCTVGRSGNDLHYRGYDILDLAQACEFEEVAHLLIHGKLPNRDELRAYKQKLKRLRGLPLALQTALETLPAHSHPMDVMRTAVSVLGCVLPEKDDHNLPDARDIADRLMACLGSALLYWYHYSHNGEMIDVQTDDDSIGAHFLHLLHGEKPSAQWEKAMHVQTIFQHQTRFKNPIRQNWTHVFALRKLHPNFQKLKYYPIVVFSGRARLKNVTSELPVLYRWQLIRYIRMENHRNLLSPMLELFLFCASTPPSYDRHALNEKQKSDCRKPGR